MRPEPGIPGFAGGGQFNSRQLEAIRQATRALPAILDRGLGVRLGHTMVVSRRVHAVSPAEPSEVQVLVDGDAGRIFYRRQRTGEVIHVDVFHQVAQVDHRRVARSLLKAVDRYWRDFAWVEGAHLAPGSRRLADYVDLQTGTGGGRLSGSLAYGRKESLRRAHLNHVHLALKVDEAHLPVLFYLGAAVEREVVSQGYEIRKVERLRPVEGGPGGGSDFSPYGSYSDSLLQRRDTSPVDQQVKRQVQLQTAMDLADDLGSVGELQDLLESFQGDPGWQSLQNRLKRFPTPGQWVERLEAQGLVVSDRREYRLTEEGSRLYQFIRTNRREIELHFRNMLRRLFLSASDLGRRDRLHREGDRRPGHHGAAPVPSGAWVPSLAVPETLVAASCRRLREGGPRLCREDLRAYHRRAQEKIDICLLIDASASMAGSRLRAARYLAEHLLLASRDRVAVICFQEREATVYVPFTRNYGCVEAGIRRIRPLGLTPLAHGLIGALEYVAASRVRNPLILLITDGIPTVPKWSMNSLADAVEAARQVAGRGIRFACVGLEPNRRFLEELTREGRGTLHVVEEIEREALVDIARREKKARAT
ncbi:MAG: VWA domain-containing protein [bacterium]|nr:VWA domain-containing protein [bacterium]